jgi:hypothetical protein
VVWQAPAATTWPWTLPVWPTSAPRWAADSVPQSDPRLLLGLVFYRRRIAPLHLIGMGISYASVAGLWQIKLQGSEAAWGALWCFQCHQLCAVPVQWRDDQAPGLDASGRPVATSVACFSVCCSLFCCAP